MLFKTSKLHEITKEISVKRKEKISNNHVLGHPNIYKFRRLRWN